MIDPRAAPLTAPPTPTWSRSTCSAGWLTSRCQTTAQRPSVCGVMRSAARRRDDHARVGEPRRCAPPSRPTIPNTPAPTLAARASSARTRLRRDARARRRRRRPRTRAGRRRRARREPRSHSREDGVPALVVGARGELGDVVGRRVGLEPAQLAEVVDRVARVARRAADAEDEQPPAALADGGEARGDRLDRVAVERRRDPAGLVEVARRRNVAHVEASRGTRQTAKVLRPNLWRWQRIWLGRNPAATSIGHRSRGS